VLPQPLSIPVAPDTLRRMPDAADSVTSFADGVWLASQPVVHLGLHLTATMTVLRLADASLLVYSPVALTPARRTAIAALGPVAHIYAPNLFHHMWLDEWIAAYPAARVHAPASLAKKHRGLRIDRPHGAPEPAFAGVVDELHIDGFRLDESVLVHRPSRTLLVADLVHNVGRPQHAWTRIYAKMNGFHDRVALSRMIRWTAFPDHRATRRSLDALLALEFDRMIVGHGDPLTSGAREAIAAAYAWLPA